jgi:hypothetical protein
MAKRDDQPVIEGQFRVKGSAPPSDAGLPATLRWLLIAGGLAISLHGAAPNQERDRAMIKRAVQTVRATFSAVHWPRLTP